MWAGINIDDGDFMRVSHSRVYDLLIDELWMLYLPARFKHSNWIKNQNNNNKFQANKKWIT